MSKIILASSSPFRKALLGRLQLTFSCISPNIDETMLANESPDQLVARLSLAKANEIATSEKNAVIIGSDQIAVCENSVIGKPGNLEKAKEQLRFLSEKTVTFHTGLYVLNSQTNESQSDVIKFFVEFRTLSEIMICNYLQKEPAFNCAGSFKSEALGVALTNKMYGDDATALVGLPLISLTKMLEKAGVDIL